MLQSLKTTGIEKLQSMLLSMASQVSDENLIRMTYLMEMIPRKESYKEMIRRSRALIRANHPIMNLPRRVMADLHPAQRDRWITNFLVNHLLLGTNIRKTWADREGVCPPATVVITPTTRCGMSCSACYAGDYRKSLELSVEEIDSVLVQMKEMGIYLAVFSGGEPFSRPELFDIFRKHHDMAFLVFTHGLLIDEELTARLAEVANVMPAISLEGLEEETDRRRGKGHFQRVMRAIDLLREARLAFSIALTQTRHNSDLVTGGELVDFVADKGAFGLWLLPYLPVGRKADTALMPTAEQRDLTRRRVADYRETKRLPILDFLNDGALANGCLAGGRKYFHINANGDIEPCVFCHVAVDNIRRTSLRAALAGDFFRTVRRSQEHDNPLRPCMIVDHPEVWQEVSRYPGGYPTNGSSLDVIEAVAPLLGDYAAEYALLADAAWEQEIAAAPSAMATGRRR